jgi:hypothetical protein
MKYFLNSNKSTGPNLHIFINWRQNDLFHAVIAACHPLQIKILIICPLDMKETPIIEDFIFWTFNLLFNLSEQTLENKLSELITY